jgi:hypothetical protein
MQWRFPAQSPYRVEQQTPNNEAWATRQRRGWQFLGRDARHP